MINNGKHRAFEQALQQAEIRLVLTRKRVKNINFRLKPNYLAVSAPMYASDEQIYTAMGKRLDWILNQHQKILQQHKNKPPLTAPKANPQTILLWGERQTDTMQETQRLALYRQELALVISPLFAKWQPIVGKQATEMRIKKMKTRWGSCNTRAKRIWLSVYLPQYPVECTEYVIVHELCHLHHANHSPAFWAEVARVMPDYQRWHNKLAGKTGVVD